MNEIEAKKIEIQEAIIARINDKVETDTDFIRFWKPEERMEESEIFKEYPTIYSVDVKFEYGKATKFPVIKTYVERNFQLFDANSSVGVVFIGLDPLVVTELRSWSRNAAYEVHKYLQEEELYFLRQIRFDFLPTDKTNSAFIIPNLPLELIAFSPKKNGKVIETETYVKSKLFTEEDLHNLVQRLQETKSSS